jgi:hypothetical protein
LNWQSEQFSKARASCRQLRAHLGRFLEVDAAPVAADAEVALEVDVRQQVITLAHYQARKGVRDRVHLHLTQVQRLHRE